MDAWFLLSELQNFGNITFIFLYTDEKTTTLVLVELMNQVRLAGTEKIDSATDKRAGQAGDG